MELIAQKEEAFYEHTLGYQTDIYTKSLTENTKRAYVSDICDFFGVENFSQMTIEKIKSVNSASAMEFRDKLLGEGKAESTINRKLTSMSSLYSFLCRHEVGIMEYNPFSGKEGLRRIRQNKRYSNTRCLTKEEVQKLVRVTMEGNDLEAVRNRIIVLLLATTGMRRSELVSIKIGQIRHMSGQDVVEIKGKGDKERLIVISTTIKVIIDKYIEMRGLGYADRNVPLLAKHTSNADHYATDGLTAQTIYRVVKAVADKAGISADDVSPHSLRHTFVTEALALGLRMEDVSDMAGHADTATTRRYDHTNRVLINNPANQLSNMFIGGE